MINPSTDFNLVLAVWGLRGDSVSSRSPPRVGFQHGAREWWEEYREWVNELQTRIDVLKVDDRISQVEIRDRPSLEVRDDDIVVEHDEWPIFPYSDWKAWAQDQGISLEPYTWVGDSRVELPAAQLIARVGDISTGDVVGVFPVVDKNRICTIDDAITTLEKKKWWQIGSSESENSVPREAAWKHHINETDGEFLLSELEDDWRVLKNEHRVAPRTSDKWSQIDYVLTTTDEWWVSRFDRDTVLRDSPGKFKLVEMKADEKGIDAAFGQLLRYREAFVDQHLVDVNNIELAIAAPSLQTSHHEAIYRRDIFEWIKLEPPKVPPSLVTGSGGKDH